MSKLKTPQESPEYGKCSYLNLVTLQGGFLYIVRPSVLSFDNLKLCKTKAVKNTCIQETIGPLQLESLDHDFPKNITCYRLYIVT